MRARTRIILSECIENGLRYGYSRAHKHVDQPSQETITQAMDKAIWNEIDERFTFDDDDFENIFRLNP